MYTDVQIKYRIYQSNYTIKCTLREVAESAHQNIKENQSEKNILQNS